MKKMLIVVCVFVMLLSTVSVQAATVTPVTDTMSAFGKYYLPEVNLGGVMEASQLQNCVVDTYNGVNYLYTTSAGNPPVFNVVNLDTKQVELTCPVSGGMKSWRHAVDSKGRVYILVISKLYCYDPETRTVTDLGRFDKVEDFAFTLCVDEKDNVYIGTANNAKIIKYDPITQTFEDMGTMMEGMQYVRTVSYHNGWLYCGVYSTNPGKMVRMELANPSNKEVYEAPPSDLYKPEEIGFFYDSNPVDDFVVFYVQTKGLYRILVFDTIKGEWVNNGYTGGFQGYYTTQPNDGKAYFMSMGVWQCLDTKTGMITDTGWKPDFKIPIFGGNWVELKNRPDMPGKTYVTINVDTPSDIILVNFESQKVEVWEDVEMKGAYLNILLMGDMPDGSVYVASGGAPKDHWFNPDTGEKADFLAGQIEGCVAYNGKLYLGAYTGARIMEYDPAQPYQADVNPRIVGVVTGQDRPFAMDAGDGLVMGGTICKYGGLPGSIFIYDTKTGEFYEENNVVHNQGIMSVAYKDGLLYGSTTIHGGLGSTPTETAAKIFVYDVAQRKKIKEFVPNIPGLNDPIPTDLGALVFGPDGKLWCATGYTIFSVNTDTEEVSDVMTFAKWEKYGTESWKWKPTYIEFDDKGNMYSNMYGMRVINPKTGEHKQLTTYAVNDYTIGGDGNLYLVTGADIRVIPILDQEPSFDYSNYAQKYCDVGKLVLKTGYPVAAANGKAQYIDGTNAQVVPIVENGRTLVPIRFIAESLGAEVSWDDATQTATLVKDAITVKISIGSTQMTVNDKTVVLDVPAQLKNERTLLPLRAVSDAFGKQVHWEECGVIIISDESQTLSDEQVTALDLYLKFQIKKNIVNEKSLEESKKAYEKLIASVKGKEVPIENYSFEEFEKDGTPKGLKYTQKDAYISDKVASVSSTVALEGKYAVHINDTSAETGGGYDMTGLIPIDCVQSYKVIVPIYAVSGKTCMEVLTYNAEGKHMYTYPLYYVPSILGEWTFPELKLDAGLKGNPKYISIRLYNSPLWRGDCYYDAIRLFEIE